MMQVDPIGVGFLSYFDFFDSGVFILHHLTISLKDNFILSCSHFIPNSP